MAEVKQKEKGKEKAGDPTNKKQSKKNLGCETTKMKDRSPRDRVAKVFKFGRNNNLETKEKEKEKENEEEEEEPPKKNKPTTKPMLRSEKELKKWARKEVEACWSAAAITAPGSPARANRALTKEERRAAYAKAVAFRSELTASFQKMDEWTGFKKKITARAIAQSAPGGLSYKKKNNDRTSSTSAWFTGHWDNIRVKPRRLSWALQHSWDYHPYAWDAEQWKAKLARAGKAKPRKSELSYSDMKLISEMPTETSFSELYSSDEETESEQPKRNTDHDDAEELFLDDEDLAGGWLQEHSDWKEGLLVESSKDGGPEIIVGGHVENLLSCLAALQIQDRSYIETFLFTYRTFVQPTDLFQFLVKRYYFLPPKDASEQTLHFHRKFAPAVQLRVINILREWLSKHWYDFASDERLLDDVKAFIDSTIQATQRNAHWHANLMAVIQQNDTKSLKVQKGAPLLIIKAAMRREVGGVIMRVMRKGRKCFYCFLGSDLVDWSMQYVEEISSKAKAIRFCEKLLTNGVMVAVRKRFRGASFEAGNRLYRLTSGYEANGKAPIPKVPSKIASWNHLSLFDIHPVELARQLTLASERIYRRITPGEVCNCAFESKNKKKTSPNMLCFMDRWDQVSNWVALEILDCENLHKRASTLSQFIEIAQGCYHLNNFFDMSAIMLGINDSSITRLSKTWKKVRNATTKAYEEMLSRRVEASILIEMRECSRHRYSLTVIAEYQDFVEQQLKASLVDVKELYRRSLRLEPRESKVVV
ncbi:Son of sevenless 1 [Balamuthia mandrillaris]